MKLHSFCVMLMPVIKLAIICSCPAESGNNASYLIRQILMKSYDPLVRPVVDFSQRVHVNLSMGLKSLIELDMKKQTLVLFAWLDVTWYDQFLRWDLNQYPFDVIHLNADMVWRPDLVIYNTVSEMDQLEDQKIKVIVEHTGKVMWYPGGLFQTFCSIDIFHYPLDTQTCSVEIIAWSSPYDGLNVTLMDPLLYTDVIFQKHPEWEVTDEEAGHTFLLEDFWVITFSFTLKRKVTFYVLNMILPILFLSLMNCLVFLLTVKSGEKMTFCVTIFLSFTVFLSSINTSLPPNSDSVCIFSVYVAVQMSLGVCCVVMSTCIVFIYEKDTDHDTVTKCELLPSNHFTTKMSVCASSYSCTKKYSEIILQPISGSTTNYSSGSTLRSESGESSRPHAESTDTDCGTRQESGKESVSIKERKVNMSTKQVWSMFLRFHHLKPYDRRLLSQQLDKICFKMILIINIIVCIIFALIWSFA